MTNEQFKLKIASMGIHLNGLFCGYDVVLNKQLELNIRMRKKASKPNLKFGEVPVIKPYEITHEIASNMATAAIETVLAIYDLQPHEDKELKIRELDLQIKHQVELIKNNIILELIKEITPAKQLQLYHLLGIKNAEQLLNGSDTIPTY